MGPGVASRPVSRAKPEVLRL